MKIATKTTLLLAICTLLIASTFSGCSKDKGEKENHNKLEGLWTGSYTITAAPEAGSSYFSFVIKPDGTLLVDSKFENKQHLAVGTWQLNGKTLTCTYSYVYGQSSSGTSTVQQATATWDEAGKLIDGTWQNTTPNNQSGTFSLARIN